MFDNAESALSAKNHYERTIFTPELPDIPAIFQNDFLEGFIKHPERFPIEVRQLRFWERSKIEYSNATNVGTSPSPAIPPRLGYFCATPSDVLQTCS